MRAADLELLRLHSATLSLVAPLAADLTQLVFLDACENGADKGCWPPTHIGTGVTKTVGVSPALVFFKHAYMVGRVGEPITTATVATGPNRPASRVGVRTAPTVTDPLLDGALLAMGSPNRPGRLRGDSTSLGYQATHALSMFSLRCSANSVHGVPSVMCDNLRASLLRDIHTHMATLHYASEEASFWRAQCVGKPMRALTHHARLLIMDVRYFGPHDPLDAKHSKVTHTRALKRALATPFVTALLKWHTDVLHGVPRDVDTEGGAPRDVRAQEAAQRSYNNSPEGSWARFAAYLELHPRRSIFYRYSLLRQREAWIRELREQEGAWGVRLGDVGHVATARDHCDAVAALDPAKPLDEEELLDSELHLIAESEALAEGAGEHGDAGWADAAVYGEEGVEGEEDDEEGPPARPGAPPRFRGKAWYPKLFAIVPGAHAVRRSLRLCDEGSNAILGRPLSHVLTNLPALHKGGAFASSIMTNGFSLSLPHRKGPIKPPPPTAEELAAGAAPPPVHPEDAAARRPLAQLPRIVSVDAGNTHLVKALENVVDPITGLARERVWGLSTVQWRNLRKDEERLTQSRAWCARLAAPGGAFPRLQTVSRKVTSTVAFLAYCAVAHGVGAAPGAYAEVLAERLKPRWAHAAFRTWSRGHAILEGFWAGVRAGSLADGTMGVRPVVLYGSAKFAATGKGRFSSPTTAMRAACVKVCGAAWVRNVDEHRSTKCCSCCGYVLAKVWARTPERIYAAAAARAAAPLPWGWTRPPPRPIPAWRVVRGLQRCDSPMCSASAFRHRDVDAARLILRNALHADAHGGEMLHFLRHVRHVEATPPTFLLWDPETH